MPPIPNGFAVVSISGTVDGSDRGWQISHAFEIAGFASTDLESIAGAISTSDYMGNAASDVSATLLDVAVGSTNPAEPYHFTRGLDASGGGGSPSGPQVSYLVTKLTALGGRRNRGRTFFPGVTEASIGNGGQVIEGDGSLRNGLENFWGDVFDSSENFTEPVLLHTDDGTPTPVLSWSLSNVVATQRRRVRK